MSNLEEVELKNFEIDRPVRNSYSSTLNMLFSEKK